jgi:hypothetical protein
MKTKLTTISFTTGLIILGLSIIGLLNDTTQSAGGINMDFPLDITRLTLSAILIFGGIKTAENSRVALLLFGVTYLTLSLLGTISPTLFGLLPHELGKIDQTMHMVGGLIAIYFGMEKLPRDALT